jgi:DNA-binding GntR family transcriptional regulator
MMMDSKIAMPATRAQVVADRLRDEISGGVLEPGARLRQQDVAARLGVSTTPVREAFISLEREGLLVRDDYKGVVVFLPTLAELTENYELRIALEPLATELAASQLEAGDLHDLGALLEAMGETRSSLDYLPLNHQFHLRIYRAARRPKLYGIIEDLRKAASAYATLFAVQVPDSAETQSEHEAIFEALAAGKGSRARRAMAAHLQHTLDVVSQRLAEAASGTGDQSANSGARSTKIR